MMIDDLLFWLELSYNKNDPIWSSHNYFKLFKPKELVDQYQHALGTFSIMSPKNVLEIGMHDGGSMALWNELFQPYKLVGIDIQTRGDSEYFRQYSENRNLAARVKPIWGVDQSDRKALRRIVSENFESDLDLIIDDASHYYEQSKISFETLFPLLRPGGLYVIEDWQWAHWKEFQTHDYFQGKAPLTNLIAEIVVLSGSALPYSPKRVHINSRMAVIERGEQPAPLDFRLLPVATLVRG